MNLRFPSDAWIKALADKLNLSPSYERSAKSWEGDFTFIIEPDEHYDDTAYLYLGLYHGKSTGAELMGDQDEKDVQFTIRAPYGTWRKVVEGQLDPIQGLMTRRLKLDGDMMMIMRYPKAAQEIIACTKTIPTEFAG
jgi:putative sterol carrier protein